MRISKKPLKATLIVSVEVDIEGEAIVLIRGNLETKPHPSTLEKIAARLGVKPGEISEY